MLYGGIQSGIKQNAISQPFNGGEGGHCSFIIPFFYVLKIIIPKLQDSFL